MKLGRLEKIGVGRIQNPLTAKDAKVGAKDTKTVL
jgi:hypothetical protein